MDDEVFFNEIKELLARGYEGGYWDYKSDYPASSEDKLKDIICMANNLENRDAYLIYGANDDGSVCGIENTTKSRMTSLDIVKFLRTKPFAGGYYPETEVKNIIIEQHELDVLVVYNGRHTPYYLQKDFGSNNKSSKNLTAGTIYTRTYDGNTEPNNTASIEQTEYLWRKRFGYDLTPFQRLINLLKKPEYWSEADWHSKRYSYNIEFPEFQIVVEESKDGYDELRFFYDNDSMSYASLKLNYLSTTLFETELWYMDEGRCLILSPEIRNLDKHNIFYYYIIKDSINGKLLPFFNYGKFQCHNRNGLEMPVLLFRNKKEQQDFEKWVDNNGEDIIKTIEDNLSSNAFYEHILSNALQEGFNRKQRIKDTAVAFCLYKKWNNGLCNGECVLL